MPESQATVVGEGSRLEPARPLGARTAFLALAGAVAAVLSLGVPVLEPASGWALLPQWTEYLAGVALLAAGIIAEELPPTMVKGRDTPVVAHRIRAANMRPPATGDQPLRPLVAR